MTLTRTHAIAFVKCYIPCLLVQLVGGYFTQMSVSDWYPGLNKSPLTPPGYMFGIVWTTLYILMAMAAAEIHVIIGSFKNRPMAWWAIQLVLGLCWSIFFFGNRSILGGLILLGATIVAAIVTFTLFWRINGKAGWLFLPLILWLTLAMHLNLYIYLHN